MDSFIQYWAVKEKHEWFNSQRIFCIGADTGAGSWNIF